LAEDIKKHLGIDSEIVRGSGGIFEVSVDNRRIFSKKNEGRFPNPGEILEKLQKLKEG